MPVVCPERKRLDFKKQEGQKSRKQRPSSPSPVKSPDADEGEEESRHASPQDSKEEKGKPARKEKKAIAVDEDDSEVEVAQTKRTRNGNRSSKRKRRAVSESEFNQSQESDAEVVTRPRRKLRRGAASKPTIVLDDDEDEEKEDGLEKSQKEEEKEEDEDEDDDEPLVTPARRRRRNIVSEDPQTPRRGSDQDKIDIEEDLEDLQDSVVKETRTRGRLANSARAQRQQHLEMLRRRRAGDRSEDIPESESEPEESSEEAEDEDEEAASDENQSPTNYQTRLNFQPENSDVESAIASNEDLDRYDDDFVLEDEENDTLGVPTGLEDMPFEFTRHAYKQTKEYFRDTVEWMVFNQLNPAFPRSAAMYQAAFSKVEVEVKGWTGSQVMSTVWSLDFYRALMARPHIEITSYPISDNHPCDACNRSKHPASFDIKLYGKAYSMDTLEALEEEEEDDDDENTREKDRNGNVLPFEDTRFYLGRNCKARAEMAHPAIHWRYQLNEWVVDYLNRMGYLSDEKILERSHWSQKRRAQYAVETVAMMDQTDEVKKMWRDFKLHLEAARESGNERFDKF